VQRINSHLHSQHTPPYVINLDPAVSRVPFACNIDIRDSINYREVMAQYRLGPNGGILTSLNLFATKVDQIVSLLEKRTAPPPPPPPPPPSSSPTPTPTPTATGTEGPRTKPISHILIDTPGQIEVFVWSASGSILLDAMASSLPTVIAYVIDTPRTASTSTFMSNMLYACSILYKTRLPMILVFNKTDVTDAAFAREWMLDFEAFQEALRREEVESGGAGEGGGGGSGYMGSLLNSMSLVLEEFYRHLSVVGVSAVTGAGVGEFFEAVEGKRAEFERDYRPELERRRREREREKVGRREEELGRLMRDVHVEAESEGAGKGANGMGRARKAAEMKTKTKTETTGREGKGKGKGRRKREPETISDLESSSDDNADFNHNDNDNDEDDDEEEEEIPAQLVDPDSSDQDNDTDDDEREENADGLTQRYRRALADESGVGGGGAGGEEKGGGKRAETEEMAKLARYLKGGGV